MKQDKDKGKQMLGTKQRGGRSTHFTNNKE